MRSRPATSFLLGLAAALAVACPAPPQAGADPVGDPTVVARVGGEEITAGELDEWIKDELFDRETSNSDPAKLYELRATSLDNLVSKRLIDEAAAARGVDADTLLDEEASKRVTVTDAEIEEFFEANTAQLGEATLESLEPRIRQFLEQRQGAEAARAYVDELQQQAGVEILMVQPRVEVVAEGPSIGPVDAPVTIVEFSDYECPFCQRAEPVLEQVLEQYEGKVRFVYRHFPLENIHPNAKPASVAAFCAGEQGKFWEYHALVFEAPDGLEADGLAKYAMALELDGESFEACLASDAAAASVQSDIQAGSSAGVTGTPAFFINGIPLKGAQPVSEFKRIIDEELATAG
jgi:protein-disulfide isomerase